MKLEVVVEEKFCPPNMEKTKIMYKYEKAPKSTKHVYQKHKFRLISELVSILFHHKNSRETFINVSNTIILYLTAFDSQYQIDIYSKNKTNNINDVDPKFKEILKQEFKN